jgi:hypothetical protein
MGDIILSSFAHILDMVGTHLESTREETIEFIIGKYDTMECRGLGCRQIEGDLKVL